MQQHSPPRNSARRPKRYLIDKGTLANRPFVSKFGVEAGRLTLFFRKRNE
jgi:hypothetical protein